MTARDDTKTVCSIPESEETAPSCVVTRGCLGTKHLTNGGHCREKM